MAAVAGPSNPQNNRKLKQRINPLKNKKVNKITEKHRIAELERAASDFEAPGDLKAFNDLPISDLTKRGLKKAFFKDMTDIQAKSLPVSLKGKDILGAAHTGSGKTLAFLVPVLEILYRRKWGPSDGLGALIISPTRELAVQIFEVLRSIGCYHSFSAGLVIGGKNLKDEKDRLSRMNILVATPGRLLQHMDQTIGFESDNLQMLVLDEADRILDMGFSRTLTALLSHLPKSRQTLLFSATQTESVTSLARLSLKSPVSMSTFMSTSQSGSNSTPQNLSQHYLVCTLDQKLSILWSFIKSHLQSKILVFVSSCKQVRFVFSTFCKLHPGVPLLHLHGKMKQSARMTMYDKFTTSSHAVLFATDIAARGLDFPSVDWVLQVDVPEDADTYIHRVGRTARYESKGNGLMFVMPSEEDGINAALKGKGIVVDKIKVKASKTQNIENQLQNLAFHDTEIKYLGQRAFVSYLRSIYLHKDKSIFKIDGLPVDRFAESLGLPGTPNIKFLNKDAKPAEPKPAVRTKYDRMFGRKNQKFEHYNKLLDHDDVVSNDESEDFMTLKREDHKLSDSEGHREENLSKRKVKMSKSKHAKLKSTERGKKLVFDEEGIPHEIYEMQDPEVFFGTGLEGVVDAGKKFAEGERAKLRTADVFDKEEAKEKRREKKRKRKDREREDVGDYEDGPQLIPFVEDDGYVSPEFELPSGNEDADPEPTSKRARHGTPTLKDEEELALRLLRGQ